MNGSSHQRKQIKLINWLQNLSVLSENIENKRNDKNLGFFEENSPINEQIDPVTRL